MPVTRPTPPPAGDDVAVASLLRSNFPEVAWTPGHLAQAARLAVVHRPAAGARVYTPGQVGPALHGVLEGEVTLRLLAADGSASVVERVRAPTLFGLASFASGLPTAYEAEVTVAARIVDIGEPAYRYLMDEVPGFGRALMREFARRHHDLTGLLIAARHQRAPERFDIALAQLRRQPESAVRRSPPAAGWRYVRVTQAELASMAGLSRQSVNELIGEARRAGRLQPAYGGLWLAP